MFSYINGGFLMKKIFLLLILMFLMTPIANALECYSAKECTVYGEMYLASKDYEKALSCFDHAISFNEKAYLAYAFRAKTNYYLKKYNQTIEDATKSIDIKPNPRAFGIRGSARLALGDYSEAINDTSLALELSPNYMKCYEVRARAKVMLSAYESALEDANKALKLNPGYPKNYEVRARAYLGLKKYSDAKRDFEVAEGLFKMQNDEKSSKKMSKLAKYSKRHIK